MFEIIKEKVKVSQAFTKIVGVEIIPSGEWFTPENETCPLCSHHDCFRINPADDFFQCFSCDKSGDVIAFISEVYKVSMLEAARAAAKEFGIDVPTSYNPIREIYRLAAEYYHNILLEDKRKYAELDGLTPLEYQVERRGHSLESLTKFQVGWSDGRVLAFLEGVGFEQELLKESGLMNKAERDFLPQKSFIYPHRIGSQVGHFTFKDPTKKLEYQVPRKFRHQGWAFFNQNSLKDVTTVYVVEGENDLISVDAQLQPHEAVVACIGMISGAQLEWLMDKCSDKNVITIFDPDDGGDKYREKLVKAASRFLSLKCVDLPKDPGDDIDDLLKRGAKLPDIVATANVISDGSKAPTVKLPDASGGEVEIELDSGAGSDAGVGSILLHNNAYYRIRYKDGVPQKSKLTNFSINLKNIYIQGDRREREVVFIREDGKHSRPVNVSSEHKVSLKSFKSLVANAVDASFYGREDDLALLWDHVYQGVSEREVNLPNSVGHVREFNGWLFQDCFIGDDGALYHKGKDGVIWLGGGSGIKPIALSDADDATSDVIPNMVTDLDKDGRKELERMFIENLVTNIGDVGVALTVLGWAKSNAYSNALFDWRRDFPFLFFWGRHGRGKTFIARWLAALYGTDHCGYVTISGLKRSVGFFRKLAYYASLPVVVDEIRADRDTVELYGTFRSWYQRSGRVLGIKEDFGIKEQKVLSTFIFVGQDKFSDEALRQRCIPVRIPINNRELEKTFNWIEANRSDLPAIGMEWILEAATKNIYDITADIDAVNSELKDAGCNQRTSRNWALVAVFGKMIADEYFPEFDFIEYVKSASGVDMAEQEDENVLSQFFQVIEGLQADEKIDSKHIVICGNEIAVWLPEIFRIVEKELVHSAREEFSKKALLELMKEEPWFVNSSTQKATMGDGVQRRVTWFNLENAPDYVKVLGEYYEKRR